MAFLNTCEILSLLSKGRYFRLRSGGRYFGNFTVYYLHRLENLASMNRRKLTQVLAVILFSLSFGMQCYIFIYSIKKSTIQGKKAYEENDWARPNVNSINIWRGGNMTASIAKFQKLLIPCSVL